jgi:hypothetical protein
MTRRALLLSVASVVILAVSVEDVHAVSISATVNGFAEEVGGSPTGVNPFVVDITHQVSFEERGIVEFSIASLVSPVSSAQVVLTLTDSGGSSFPVTYGVSGYVGNGTLEQTDFNAGAAIASLSYSGGPTLAIDVTSFLNGLIGSATFAGVNVRQSEVQEGIVQFNVTSNAVATLEVNPAAPTAVPEPATLLLVGSSFAGAGLARWRHQRRKDA